MQLENIIHFTNTNAIIDIGQYHKYMLKPLDKGFSENNIFFIIIIIIKFFLKWSLEKLKK